jgi:hypothetical protein
MIKEKEKRVREEEMIVTMMAIQKVKKEEIKIKMIKKGMEKKKKMDLNQPKS